MKVIKDYYLILDTETATLPYYTGDNEKTRKGISIAKPLVYDIGWVISDRQGNIIKESNYLIQETFFVSEIFSTAFYKEKRPMYFEKLKSGDIQVAKWLDAITELLEDCKKCKAVAAYNACFDFKKAIPFTDNYITALYFKDFAEYEERQKKSCYAIEKNGKTNAKNPDYLNPIFKLKGEEFPIIDIWGLACEKLINNDRYKSYCCKNRLFSDSKQYFSTSAETSFQYLTKQHNFIESHTALDDAKIESEILSKALKKGKVEPNIAPFPFRNLGTTYQYVIDKAPKYIDTLIQELGSVKNKSRKTEQIIACLISLKNFEKTY